MSQEGSIDQLPAGDTKQKMQNWAQDIVSGRLAQAGRQFDGISDNKTQLVNDLLNNPAFAALPEQKQNQLLDGLRSGYDMMQYAPGEPSEAQLALEARLQKHFGIPAAEVKPELNTEVNSETRSEQVSLSDFEQTLKQNAGLFGGGAKSPKIQEQGQSLFAANPNQIQQASQLLSDGKYFAELSNILSKQSTETIATVLTQPTIRGLDIIESADNPVAGQFLTALAESQQADAEALIADTLKKFDGIFVDREQPFEILIQSPAFQTLSADLQEKIKNLVKYF